MESDQVVQKEAAEPSKSKKKHKRKKKNQQNPEEVGKVNSESGSDVLAATEGASVKAATIAGNLLAATQCKKPYGDRNTRPVKGNKEFRKAPASVECESLPVTDTLESKAHEESANSSTLSKSQKRRIRKKKSLKAVDVPSTEEKITNLNDLNLQNVNTCVEKTLKDSNKEVLSADCGTVSNVDVLETVLAELPSFPKECPKQNNISKSSTINGSPLLSHSRNIKKCSRNSNGTGKECSEGVGTVRVSNNFVIDSELEKGSIVCTSPVQSNLEFGLENLERKLRKSKKRTDPLGSLGSHASKANKGDVPESHLDERTEHLLAGHHFDDTRSPLKFCSIDKDTENTGQSGIEISTSSENSSVSNITCTPSYVQCNDILAALRGSSQASSLPPITSDIKSLFPLGNLSRLVPEDFKTNLSQESVYLQKDNTVSAMEPEKTKPGRPQSVPHGKNSGKSREEILAEREAKKAAKLAAKKKKQEGLASGGGDENKEQADEEGKSRPKKDLPAQKSDKDKEAFAEESVWVTPEEATKGEIAQDESASSQPEGKEVQKSKAQLKAERRAKQEEQRAKKAGSQQKAGEAEAESSPIVKGKEQGEPEADKKSPRLKAGDTKTTKSKRYKVKLFSHLIHQQEPTLAKEVIMASSSTHPAIVCLGVQYAQRVIIGSNARCVALLRALKQVILDFETPPQKEFARALETQIQSGLTFLEKCRPMSVSMTNALRFLKWQMTQLPNNISDSDAKDKLKDAVDKYVYENIELADKQIMNTVLPKISNGDVILTYGCSSLLQYILIKAHEKGKKFRVVIVDGRPWREGREMLRNLVQKGLSCTYVLISAASFIMREVTKVFLGAHALLANGCVMSRAGSSQVALVAHSYNVPVLVCCETYKFCERVQTDSFVYNELGNPDDLVISNKGVNHLKKWKDTNSLSLLNLTYDVTPPDLVTAVVTELAILPCTSIPVVVRVKHTEAGF